MANKEQIQKALDELWTRYGNTLSMLTDAIDKIDEKDQRISELEKLVIDSENIDIDLSTPSNIADLEKSVLGKTQ